MIAGFFRNNPLAILFGAITGLVLAFASVPAIDAGADRVREAYDIYAPVAKIDITREGVSPGEVRVRMIVHKYRECELLQTQAFEAQPFGWQRINASRVDDADGANVPGGMVVRGYLWRLWPHGGGELRMTFAYDCGGRVVRLTRSVP